MLHLEAERPSKYFNCRHNFGRNQACSQVLRFGGAKHIFMGKRVYIYYMFETNLSEHNKIWRAQKRSGITVPECPPCLRAWAEPLPESLPLWAFIFVQGARHSEN